MGKIIQQGAEAIIQKTNRIFINESLRKEIKILKSPIIQKYRITKGYRIKELDTKLRKSRTKSEAKIIEKLKNIINVPKIIHKGSINIYMQYISGKKLSEHLESLNYKTISKQIGQALTKLHNQDIIHGDLTTSNMILKTNKLYLIDFGLGFHSHKIEDKAVDLHLLKQALEAKHFTIADKCFKTILKNYKPEQAKLIIERIPVIESRGKYKKKH